jgi:hypothetical protein
MANHQFQAVESAFQRPSRKLVFVEKPKSRSETQTMGRSPPAKLWFLIIFSIIFCSHILFADGGSNVSPADEGERLIEFWKPHGAIDPVHEKLIQDWMNGHGLQNELLTTFLYDSLYADLRSRAVDELIATEELGAGNVVSTHEGEILHEFWKPHGELNTVHEKLLRDWMTSHGLPTDSVANFLYSYLYGVLREKAVSELVGADARDRLQNFWKPNGEIDLAHEKLIRDWMNAHGLQDEALVTLFYSPLYAKQLIQATEELIAVDRPADGPLHKAAAEPKPAATRLGDYKPKNNDIPSSGSGQTLLYVWVGAAAGIICLLFVLGRSMGPIIKKVSTEESLKRELSGNPITSPPVIATPPVEVEALSPIQRSTKDHAWVNSLGMKFVPVAGTPVLFSVWHTRVQDFRAFMKNNPDYDPPGEMWSLSKDNWKQRGATWKEPGFQQSSTDPVVGVSWDDAKAFCAWLTKRERDSGALPEDSLYRLLTDEEWSIAVGLDSEPGNTPEEKDSQNNVYPWRKRWPPLAGAGNYRGVESKIENEPTDWDVIEGYNDGYPRTSPVGSFAANQFGLYDMGGNVWQWCEDWYNSEKKFRVLRGASWNDNDPGNLLASRRFKYMPAERGASIGFRCVLLRPAQPLPKAPNLPTRIQQPMPIDSKARIFVSYAREDQAPAGSLVSACLMDWRTTP